MSQHDPARASRSSPDTSGSLGTDQRFGPFLLLRRLAETSCGRTYAARDANFERECVLQLFEPSQAADPQLFQQEAALLSSFGHALPARLLSHGQRDGIWYLAWEALPGPSLAAPGAAPGMARVLALGIELARCLAELHRRGLVHRALEPDQLVLGGDGRVRLRGFDLGGLAKSSRAAANPYRAPELAISAATPASDLFALGASLHFLVAGCAPPALPAGGSSSEAVRLFPAQIPPALRPVMLRCLAVDPAERYGTADELADALERVQANISRSSRASLRGLLPHSGVRVQPRPQAAGFAGLPPEAQQLYTRLAAGGTPLRELLLPGTRRDTLAALTVLDQAGCLEVLPGRSRAGSKASGRGGRWFGFLLGAMLGLLLLWNQAGGAAAGTGETVRLQLLDDRTGSPLANLEVQSAGGALAQTGSDGGLLLGLERGLLRADGFVPCSVLGTYSGEVPLFFDFPERLAAFCSAGLDAPPELLAKLDFQTIEFGDVSGFSQRISARPGQAVQLELRPTLSRRLYAIAFDQRGRSLGIGHVEAVAGETARLVIPVALAEAGLAGEVEMPEAADQLQAELLCELDGVFVSYALAWSPVERGKAHYRLDHAAPQNARLRLRLSALEDGRVVSSVELPADATPPTALPRPLTLNRSELGDPLAGTVRFAWTGPQWDGAMLLVRFRGARDDLWTVVSAADQEVEIPSPEDASLRRQLDGAVEGTRVVLIHKSGELQRRAHARAR